MAFFVPKMYFISLLSMKIINPNDTTHTIKFIPRLYIGSAFVDLYNEETRVTDRVDNIISIIDGYAYVTFDYTFDKNTKYQIKIFNEKIFILTEGGLNLVTEGGDNVLSENLVNSNEVVYRGKITPLEDEPQNYKQTKEFYYYV